MGSEQFDHPRYPVRLVRNIRIPMTDGVTLAADAFFPDAPGRFPAVFDLTPYRKNDIDWSAPTDQRYYAERGFVALCIDVRGTGDSEGTALDEYAVQEQLDGVSAVAWLAEQEWCNGKVGMFGQSYTGFNSLQVAMHRPPALKAICPVYFTDRRYTDDCHYKGGAMQMLYDLATYGLTMVGSNLLPPRSDLVGERWAAIWEEHLQNEPWLLRWIDHQTEDEQWRNGSLCEDYGAIECATFMIGGWRDGYTNCNLRTFERLTCPKKLLIGPWLHVAPNQGLPGPAVNHHREMARFFSHWLADDDTGVMDEPPIALFVQRYDKPLSDRTRTTGEWRSEPGWPLERSREVTLHLTPGALSSGGPAATATAQTLEYHPSVGTTFGMFPGATPNILPIDQRLDETFSAVYTGPVLAEPLEILGYPTVTLHVESSAPIITYVARLCDVAPDGTSALVAKAILNATHRESHVAPSALVPGQVYEIQLDLDATSWIFEPGHRIRLSIANADFPNTWPSPYPATSVIHHGEARPSRLTLPGLAANEHPLPPPDLQPMPDTPSFIANPGTYRVTRDQVRGLTEVTIGSQRGAHLDAKNWHELSREATASVDDRNPAYATISGEQTIRHHSFQKTVEVQTRAQIESSETVFQMLVHAAITVDGKPHFSKQWIKTVPRHLL